jgi:hypothetical protein
MENNNTYAETLREKGWILVKNFFDAETIDRFRSDCIKFSKEGSESSDLLSNKYLSHLFTDEKLVKFLADLIGGKPVYFGDSSFQIASVEGRISNGFHKDSVDRKNANGLDWGNDYSIIRLGIYLQDHRNHSEGLVVRTGSHKTIDVTKGKKVNVPSEKGDLIVWYLTTTHSGNARRIKGIDYPVLMGDFTGGWFAQKLYYHLPKILLKPSEKDRIAIFATFGKQDIHLKRYLEYLKHRSYMVETWKKINYDCDAVEKIQTQNLLELIDMKDEAQKIDSVKYPPYDFDQFEKFNI